MFRRPQRLAPLLVVLALAAGLTATQVDLSGHAPGYQTPYGLQAHSPSFGRPTGAQVAPGLAAIPTVEMRDSVTVSAIPAGTRAVAGYLSGNWPTFRGLVLAFPHAYHVAVAIHAVPVYPSLVGRMVCLDVEPGDATPAQAGAWVRGELGLHVTPCVYTNLSTMPAVRASISAAGIARARYRLWVAYWTFHPGLLPGYDAVQWADHGPHGENYDESTVSYAFLGIHPKAPLPICVTRRMTRSACAAAKSKIASDQRAAASSQRVFTARGCQVLSQRVSWFSTRLREDPKVKAASRRRALAASRSAYRQRSCSTFRQRAAYFTAAASAAEAAS